LGDWSRTGLPVANPGPFSPVTHASGMLLDCLAKSSISFGDKARPIARHNIKRPGFGLVFLHCSGRRNFHFHFHQCPIPWYAWKYLKL
jgi:hypothetical protein